MSYLFVYGSLKRDFSNHYIIRSLKFLGEAKTVNKYQLFNGKFYPMMVDREPGFNIHGELFEITPDQFDKVDSFEGHPDLFIRKEIKVILLGEELTAYCYFYNKNDIPENDDTILDKISDKYSLSNTEKAKLVKKIFS